MMGRPAAPAPGADLLESVDDAVRRFGDAWRRGDADLDRVWGDYDGAEPARALSELIKADMQERFARGERPTANDYLARYPELRPEADRVLSLIYEEYCLRVERGDKPDTVEFCQRYEPWKDSLESQLRCHWAISQAVVGAMAAPAFPPIGSRFGSYEILHVLGRGGAANVYLARDTALGDRPVALKVSANRGAEPALLGRLNHPHIVPVLTVQTEPDTGLRGLCMPYRAGLPLNLLINRLKKGARPTLALDLWRALIAPAADDEPALPTPPPPPDALPTGPGWDGFPIDGAFVEAAAWVALKLAEALASSHAIGIWHRDVKPANILLTFEGGPQLLDFNLAHDPNSVEAAAAALRGGTLPYMAPEHLQAFLDASRWDEVLAPADVYSLGLVFRELVTGLPPEMPESDASAPRAIRHLLDRRPDLRPGLRQNDPSIPDSIEAVAERCLACRPEDRYAAAEELAEDLSRYLARLPLKHAPNRSRRERVGNWMHRKRRVLLAGAAGLFLTAGVVFAAPRPAPPIAPAAPEPGLPAPLLVAMSDLQKLDHTHALEVLASQPDSPLVLFLRANAVAATAGVVATLDALDDLWKQPDVDAELLRFARKDPRFIRYATKIHTVLLDEEHPPTNPADAARLIDSAVRLARICHEADSSPLMPRQVLALDDERSSRYEEAYERLSQLIRDVKPDTLDGRKSLHGFRFTRARVIDRWVEKSLGEDTNAHALNLLKARLKEGLDDSLRIEGDALEAFRKDEARERYLHARLHALLAEVGARQSDGDLVRSSIEESRRIVDQLPDAWQETTFVKDLRGRLERLEMNLASTR